MTTKELIEKQQRHIALLSDLIKELIDELRDSTEGAADGLDDDTRTD